MKKEERDELTALITKSAATMIAANRMVSVVNDAKNVLLRLVFTDIAAKIEEQFLMNYGNGLVFDGVAELTDESLQKFYAAPKNAYAHVGVYFSLPYIELGDAYELKFGIEVETNLYCQFFLYDRAAKNAEVISADFLPKLKPYFGDALTPKGNTHPDWAHLPLIEGRDRVNFRDRELMDDEILSLFDDEKRATAIERAMPTIEMMLKKINWE